MLHTSMRAMAGQEPTAVLTTVQAAGRSTAAASPPWRFHVFLLIWALTTLGTGWQVVSGERRFDQLATLWLLPALLACTAALLWWLPGPALPASAGAARTKRGTFTLLILLVLLLFLYGFRTS